MIGVTVPTTVELTVAETQPSIKGATVTGSGKPATMETGLVVNVPRLHRSRTKTRYQHCRRNLRFSCLISRKRSFYGELKNNLAKSLSPHVYSKNHCYCCCKVRVFTLFKQIGVMTPFQNFHSAVVFI